MDDYLRDMTTMETMLLYTFKNDDQLGDDAHIANTFFESLKFASTTPLFNQSKSTQLGTTMLLYKLKSNVWHVKHMFLINIEVIDHQVHYILRNFVTQSTLKMIDFMNIK